MRLLYEQWCRRGPQSCTKGCWCAETPFSRFLISISPQWIIHLLGAKGIRAAGAVSSRQLAWSRHLAICSIVQFKTSLTWAGNMKTIKIPNQRSSPLFSDNGKKRRNAREDDTSRWAQLHIPSAWVHLNRAEQPAEATTHMQKHSVVSFLHQFSEPGAVKQAAGGSMLHFESELYIKKAAGFFLSQDRRIQQGNTILCPIKTYFSQKTTACVNMSVFESGIDSHCDSSFMDPCWPGIQTVDKSLMIRDKL